MEDEERKRLHLPVVRVVGALERVRPLPGGRDSLLSRLSRTARAVLDRRWDESKSLNAEKAMLLFSSPCAAESRAERALARRDTKRAKISSGNGEDRDKTLRVATSHAIGPRTMVDSVIEGSSIQVSELRIRVTHTPPLPRIGDGRISVTGGTDLRRRHRVAVESMMCSNDDKHSLSAIVSTTDFSSPLTWGMASSHKLARGLSLFWRYSCDHYAGRRIIFQAVQTSGRNTISPIVSVASKGRMQAGITLKSGILCSKGSDDFLQMKALCSEKGVFSVFWKAQLGDPVE